MNSLFSSLRKRRDFIKTISALPLAAAVPAILAGKPGLRHSEILKNVEGKLPEGKLGDLTLSRMLIGCNQISGYAHARDLNYANTLFKAYNTDEKVIETLHIAEMAGVTAAFMTNPNYPVFNRYLREMKGKMKSICQTYLKPADFLGDIDRAVDNGANALYIQGGEADRYVREGKIQELRKAVEHIKKKGFMAGVGAHALTVIRTCEEQNIPADFYVKTFHHDKYWSAHPVEQREEFSVDAKRSNDHNQIHDNMFDLFPDKTRDYMKTIKKPWIAFKVLAGGAILPADGFRFAFENGADFICVGMFDFQVVDNVNSAFKVLTELKNREREWFS
ncbi:MAG: hypothetical protein ACM3UT_04070 [Chloroflexota bacterium]